MQAKRHSNAQEAILGTIDGARTEVRESNRLQLGSASLGTANPTRSSGHSANEKKFKESSLRRQ
jgi:hypothetical protein